MILNLVLKVNQKFKKGDTIKFRTEMKTGLDYISQETTCIFSHYSCWDFICFVITENGLLPIEVNKIYLDRTKIINELLDE